MERIITDVGKFICVFHHNDKWRDKWRTCILKRESILHLSCLVECNNTGILIQRSRKYLPLALLHLNATCSIIGNIMPRGAGTHNARPTCWDIARIVFQSPGLPVPRASAMIRVRMQNVLQYWIAELCITIVKINQPATSRDVWRRKS